jgi:hypothetical protein
MVGNAMDLLVCYSIYAIGTSGVRRDKTTQNFGCLSSDNLRV